MRPAAAVATPAATVVLDDPFELEFELRAFPPVERDGALRLRDEAAEDRRLEALALLRLDALALFGLLRELADLLRELAAAPFEAEPRLLLLEALLLFGLDPFELREVVFRLLEDPVLAWAITPP